MLANPNLVGFDLVSLLKRELVRLVYNEWSERGSVSSPFFLPWTRRSWLSDADHRCPAFKPLKILQSQLAFLVQEREAPIAIGVLTA